MSMKLLVLGLLLERDLYPYEIRQTIKERHWNTAFQIRDGSLYYAVDQMREDGWIEPTEIIPVPGNNRPDKIVYRITEKGKAALTELLHNQLSASYYPFHTFYPVLPFVRHANHEQVANLVRQQIAACESRLQKIKALLELKQSYLPKGSVHMLKGILQFSETELAWLQDILHEAESGELFKLNGPLALNMKD